MPPPASPSRPNDDSADAHPGVPELSPAGVLTLFLQLLPAAFWAQMRPQKASPKQPRVHPRRGDVVDGRAALAGTRNAAHRRVGVAAESSVWGGPLARVPGPRGSPWTRSWHLWNLSLDGRDRPTRASSADQGPPHNFCRCSAARKLSGIGAILPAKVGIQDSYRKRNLAARAHMRNHNDTETMIPRSAPARRLAT